MKLTPVAYGCAVEMIPLGIEAVDTHRPKPQVQSLNFILRIAIIQSSSIECELCASGSRFPGR